LARIAKRNAEMKRLRLAREEKARLAALVPNVQDGVDEEEEGENDWRR